MNLVRHWTLESGSPFSNTHLKIRVLFVYLSFLVGIFPVVVYRSHYCHMSSCSYYYKQSIRDLQMSKGFACMHASWRTQRLHCWNVYISSYKTTQDKSKNNPNQWWKKWNCQARYVPFVSHARIPKGVRFTNSAALLASNSLKYQG